MSIDGRSPRSSSPSRRPDPRPCTTSGAFLPGTPAAPSAGLLLQIRRARRRRTVTIALMGDLGREVPEFPLRATLDADAEGVAARARSWLGVAVEEQGRWTGDYGPLSAWIAAFEAHGVLVFQTGEVALEEMRGFALAERRLPVIVLNAKDAPRGRIFTPDARVDAPDARPEWGLRPTPGRPPRAEPRRTRGGLLQPSRRSHPGAA